MLNIFSQNRESFDHENLVSQLLAFDLYYQLIIISKALLTIITIKLAFIVNVDWQRKLFEIFSAGRAYGFLGNFIDLMRNYFEALLLYVLRKFLQYLFFYFSLEFVQIIHDL